MGRSSRHHRSPGAIRGHLWGKSQLDFSKCVLRRRGCVILFPALAHFLLPHTFPFLPVEQEAMSHNVSDEVAWTDAWVDFYVKNKVAMRFAVDLDNDADAKILDAKWTENVVDDGTKTDAEK